MCTGGEWITAYETDQRRRLRAVLSTSVRETESARVLRPPTNTREVSCAPRKVLDGFFLLKHCYVEDPTDLCVCNISGEGLQDVSLVARAVHISDLLRLSVVLVEMSSCCD